MNPYDRGYDDYLAGKEETANPYDPQEDFDSYTSWNDGWMAAYNEHED